MQHSGSSVFIAWGGSGVEACGIQCPDQKLSPQSLCLDNGVLATGPTGKWFLNQHSWHLDQMNFCCGGCHVYCSPLSRTPVLYPPCVSSHLLHQLWHHKRKQTLQNVLWRVKSPWVENHLFGVCQFFFFNIPLFFILYYFSHSNFTWTLKIGDVF